MPRVEVFFLALDRQQRVPLLQSFRLVWSWGGRQRDSAVVAYLLIYFSIVMFLRWELKWIHFSKMLVVVPLLWFDWWTTGEKMLRRRRIDMRGPLMRVEHATKSNDGYQKNRNNRFTPTPLPTRPRGRSSRWSRRRPRSAQSGGCMRCEAGFSTSLQSA